MYLMDMLDNDLMKIRKIQEYRYDRYKLYSRRVLVLTSGVPFHRELHDEFLKSLHHVVFLPLNLDAIILC